MLVLHVGLCLLLVCIGASTASKALLDGVTAAIAVLFRDCDQDLPRLAIVRDLWPSRKQRHSNGYAGAETEAFHRIVSHGLFANYGGSQTSILYPGGRKVLNPTIKSVWPSKSSETRWMTPGVSMLRDLNSFIMSRN